MGLLKHAIIPFFAALHLYVAYLLLVQDGGKKAALELFGWPPKAGKDQSFTVWEEHAFSLLGGAHLMLGAGCLLGIVQEKSHFRGILVGLELVYLASGTYDAHLRGFPTAVPLGMTALALVGLIIHALEPGIFTKDKAKAKTG